MKNRNLFFITILSVVMSLFTTSIFAMTSQKNKPILFVLDEKYGLLNNNLDVIVKPENEKGFLTIDKDYAIFGKTKNLNYNFVVVDYNGNILFAKETKFDGLKNIASEQIYFKPLSKTENNFIYVPSKDTIIPLTEKLTNIYSVTNTSDREDYIAAEKYYYDLQNQRKVLYDKNFLHVMPMIDGVAVIVDKNFKKKIINRDGKIIYDDVINSTRNFTEGLLAVKGNSKSGFMDKTGNIVFECSIYPDGKDSPKGIPTLNCSFSESLAYVPTEKNSWTLFDKSGNIIKEHLKYYPSGNIYSEGYLLIYDKEKNKLGFLNKQGEVEIPFVFDKANSFQNGYANVIYDGKDALIDLEGNLFFCEDLLNKNKVPKFNLKYK